MGDARGGRRQRPFRPVISSTIYGLLLDCAPAAAKRPPWLALGTVATVVVVRVLLGLVVVRGRGNSAAVQPDGTDRTDGTQATRGTAGTDATRPVQPPAATSEVAAGRRTAAQAATADARQQASPTRPTSPTSQSAPLPGPAAIGKTLGEATSISQHVLESFKADVGKTVEIELAKEKMKTTCEIRLVARTLRHANGTTECLAVVPMHPKMSLAVPRHPRLLLLPQGRLQCVGRAPLRNGRRLVEGRQRDLRTPIRREKRGAHVSSVGGDYSDPRVQGSAEPLR